MVRSPHIDSLIASLDQVIYASFVTSYILDANLLNLVIRCISQIQFSAPKTHHPERSLTFHMAACALLNTLTILYHSLVPFDPNPRGIIIDFIGINATPSTLKIFVIDVITAILQALMLLLAYETSHYGKEAILDDSEQQHNRRGHDADATNEQSPPGDEDVIAITEEESQKSFIAEDVEDRPIVNLHLRQTLRRIANDKPYKLSAGEDAEDATSSLIRRARARIRQRNINTGQSTSPSPDNGTRHDQDSDEEREVGIRPSNS